MRRSLALHPDARCDAVKRLDVKATRPRLGTLRLDWRLTGRLEDLRLPQRSEPLRRDDLWRRTCFEAFVAPGSGYFELNLAPSTEWQAYRFDSHRSGRTEAELPPPSFDIRVGGDTLRLGAEVHGLPPVPWRLNLAAVIEEADGRLSCWAVAHPPGQPDFHHPDCFTLDLPPPA